LTPNFPITGHTADARRDAGPTIRWCSCSAEAASAGTGRFSSDAGRKIQKDRDIAEYTDPQHDPMIPHVVVLEPGRVIYKIYVGYWFFGRPTIEELRQDFPAVLKKRRARLGHHDAGAESAVDRRAQAHVLPLRQDARASNGRTG
jgi:hypothetical protein